VQGPQVGAILRQLLNDVVGQPTLNDRNTLLQRAQTYVNAEPNTPGAPGYQEPVIPGRPPGSR
jgi:hypothetical protein